MTLTHGLKKMQWGLAVAVLATLGSVTVCAQAPATSPTVGPDSGAPGMGPHRPPMERAMRGEHARWWNSPETAEKYKLSDSQRKAMDDIYQQHRVSLVDLHGTLEKAELAMEPMMRADQPDESKILAQIDQVAQARAELEKANARMLFEIRRQLTPEQWKQIQADRAAHSEHRGLDHGPGPMGHEGAPRWRGGQTPPPGAPAPPAENE
jgi:protein CpxP